MLIQREHGAEHPYWPLGPFKIRLPFIHYRWEFPEMMQGLFMFVVSLGMIPLLMKYLGMPYEAALAFCVIAGIGYLLPALLGVPLVPGWITPAIPVRIANRVGAIGSLTTIPERVAVKPPLPSSVRKWMDLGRKVESTTMVISLYVRFDPLSRITVSAAPDPDAIAA